jgi:hypothetical protein
VLPPVPHLSALLKPGMVSWLLVVVVVLPICWLLLFVEKEAS